MVSLSFVLFDDYVRGFEHFFNFCSKWSSRNNKRYVVYFLSMKKIYWHIQQLDKIGGTEEVSIVLMKAVAKY